MILPQPRPHDLPSPVFVPSLLQRYLLTEGSVSYFQPLIQHSLLSFLLRRNPHKLIYVENIPEGSLLLLLDPGV